ncbi:MAG: hypothetical protein HRU20_13460 [Pseudomonadales bacterium]|nr:hypothetical protein [Pseudomonadales bacterium]
MRSIEEFARWGYWLRAFTLDKLSIYPGDDAVREILENNPKLVIAMNHGTASAPSYVNPALMDVLLKNGGAKRHPVGVVWKHFYKVPGLKQAMTYLTQVDRPLSFDEFVEKFSHKDCSDFMVMPEGENCIFGDGIAIQPFMSSRFLELAIRTECPVLLAVHYGSHVNVKTRTISKKQAGWIKKVMPVAGEKVEASGMLTLPNFLGGKLPELKMAFELYQPQLTLDDLPADKDECKALLNEEAQVIRAKMQLMVDMLQAQQ